MLTDAFWRRHYDPQVLATIDIPDITLPEIFYRSAADFPENPAIIFLGKKISYRRLQQLVLQAAAGLSRLGLEAGQPVAVLLPNCPQTVITYYAALHLGAMVVMINPASRASGDSGPDTAHGG